MGDGAKREIDWLAVSCLHCGFCRAGTEPNCTKAKTNHAGSFQDRGVASFAPNLSVGSANGRGERCLAPAATRPSAAIHHFPVLLLAPPAPLPPSPPSVVNDALPTVPDLIPDRPLAPFPLPLQLYATICVT
ncbi:hypothetical protein DFJ73DRAFT_917588 [Zopfochytrium polystomum]|nr:hypothetical protein DFJ73DRAFT_917588 [Zopfochytrium polystomum]